MIISDIINSENILIGAPIYSKEEALHFLSNRSAKSLNLEESDVLAALKCREDLGSTGIGAGIAIPHASVEGVLKPFTLLIKLVRPIQFDAIDEKPVDIICLILLPIGEQETHLKLLAELSRQLRRDKVIDVFRSTNTPEDIYSIIIQKNNK
nr:PTS sugar transporter subunit IIA [uncultured Cohaesibacter sp.]